MDPSPDVRIVVSHRDAVVRLGLMTALARSTHRDRARSCTPGDERYAAWIDSAAVLVTDYAHGLSVFASAAARSDPSTAAALPRSPRVLIVHGRDKEHDIRTAIDAGVQGYLSEGFELSELVEAVEQLCRGGRYLSASAARGLHDDLLREQLTPREMQVLQCLIEGQVTKQICQSLHITLGTVKTHIKSIFSKLGVATRTQAVRVAGERGLRRQAERDRS